MNLNQEFTELLRQKGCHIVGFADLRILPEELRAGLDVGVIMGKLYQPRSVQDRLKNTPPKSANMGKGVSLERYNEMAVSFLEEKGYQTNITYPKTKLTYKTVATLAGIGWIGRSALLVTKELGSAVQLTAVLTDAPFDCGTPVTASQCPPDCTECADMCPTKAIKGGLWKRGVHRDEFFDVKACQKGRIKAQCQALCIASCPYTKQGLGYE